MYLHEINRIKIIVKYITNLSRNIETKLGFSCINKYFRFLALLDFVRRATVMAQAFVIHPPSNSSFSEIAA